MTVTRMARSSCANFSSYTRRAWITKRACLLPACQPYTMSLNEYAAKNLALFSSYCRSKGSREDVDDVFRAIQEHTEGDTCGAPAPRKDSIAKDYLSQLLKNEFELDVETALIDDILSCSKGSELARDEMATFLAAPVKA